MVSSLWNVGSVVVLADTLLLNAPGSTLEPPVPRDEIDPSQEGSYTVVETYEDFYAGDQGYFGLGEF